jgi:ribonuclease E
VPLNIASYLLNEKRQDVADIERRTGTHLVIVPNVNMETPQFEVQRVRADHAAEQDVVPSYELAEAMQVEEETATREVPAAPASERPAVKTIQPTTPARTSKPRPAAKPDVENPGWFKRVIGSLFSGGEQEAAQSTQAKQQRPPARSQRNNEQKAPRRQQSRNRQHQGDGQKGGQSATPSEGTRDESQSKSSRNQRQTRQEGNRQSSSRDKRQGDNFRGGRRDGKGNGDQPRRAERTVPAGERPDEASLADSKRHPKRDRSKLDSGERNGTQGRPAQSPQANVERQPKQPEAEQKPAVVTEAPPQSSTAQSSDNAAPSRAANDPRSPSPQETAAASAQPVPEPEKIEATAYTAQNDPEPEKIEATAAAAAVDSPPEAPAAEKAEAEAPPAPATETAQAEVPAAPDRVQAAPDPSPEPEKPAEAPRPARAYNDPREIRRREREAELQAEGVIPKTGR